MLDPNFVYLGAVIVASGDLSYLYSTIKGTVQPNRITWFLWGVAPLIAFIAQTQQNVGVQSALTFSFAAVPLLIFAASFLNKKSYWKITKFDLLFGGLSLLGLILWQITGIGNIAILFSIMSDGLAAIPTIMKSYHDPESESVIPYFASSVGALITLLTIDNWNFQTYSFPLYVVIICSILVILIQFKLGKRLSGK